MPAGRILGVDLLQQGLDHFLFEAARRSIHPAAAVLQLITFVQQQRHIAAVVHHQLGTLATRMAHCFISAFPILFQRLALPGEYRNARRRNRRRRVILRGENIAARPTHIGAKVHQRLNQHGRLNRHMQRSGDAHSGQRLIRCVLLADGHQAGHLKLGDGDFFPAPIGQFNVGHLVLGSHGGSEDCAHSMFACSVL